MSTNFIKEACVETLAQAVHAQALGADRLELCSQLEVDGLTPSGDLIKCVVAAVTIPVRVMIRPRKGDFCYTFTELMKMKDSIGLCKEIGVEGVVFGVLNQKNTLDLKVIRQLTKSAKPLKVVFHKAIDETPNPIESLKELLELGVIDTVLTSGGKPSAFDGVASLKETIHLADSKIEIMPGGKITSSNLAELHDLIGARAYHGKLIVGKLN